MEGPLLSGVAGKGCVTTTLDEEGGGKRVSPQDGQVEKAVPLRVHTVQVTLVAHEGGRNPLVAVEEGEVEGDVPFVITLVKSMRQLH